MKTTIIAFLLFFNSPIFSATFQDYYTGMKIDIPDEFQLCEECSDTSIAPYWYTFEDEEGNVLTIEIEEYSFEPPLAIHFHKTMSDSDFLEERSVSLEDLDFCEQQIKGIDFTKLMIRLIAQTDKGARALYFCDYLFVHDCYGITIGIMKNEKNENSASDMEKQMIQVLESITFQSEEAV